MAPSAVPAEMEAGRLGLKDSTGATMEQPKPTRRGGEDLTPLQAVSHGPITLRGILTSVYFLGHVANQSTPGKIWLYAIAF